ncbi:MAG: exonuclease domain-containing protein, partial [Candidatus Fermentibacteria bacterium]
CEVAFLLSTYEGFVRNPQKDVIVQELILPPEPVPPEASAVHHITDNMLAGKPSLEDISGSISDIVSKADYISAHNLPFDLAILKRQLPDIFGKIDEGIKLDSLRLSRHIWPSIPSHALQVLRYRFALDSDITGDAHRAMFDTELVRSLVEYILKMHLATPENWAELVKYTRSALEVKIFSFGKYRGKLVEDIAAQDTDYIRWLLRQDWIPSDYPDLYHTLLSKTAGKGKTT